MIGKYCDSTFTVMESLLSFIIILQMTQQILERFIFQIMVKIGSLCFLRDKKFQRNHKFYSLDKKMKNNLIGQCMILILDALYMHFQENSVFLEQIITLNILCLQIMERIFRQEIMKNQEFRMLLESLYLHITDLEMKLTLQVMFINSNQRNQKEISSNMLIMMERFSDSLQDLILKFLKMLTEDSLSLTISLMIQFQSSNLHKRTQEQLKENSQNETNTKIDGTVIAL